MLLCCLWVCNGYGQVEIYKGEPDTATYIPPEDTITRPPQFESGEADFFRYMELRFNMRNNSQALDLQGEIVRFSFYVEKDGSITDYTAMFSTNAIIASEIERIVTTMPKWSPGYSYGKKKRTLMVYDLSVRPVYDLPGVEISKNSSSAQYTSKTKDLKWFIVGGSVLVLLTLWLTGGR